MQKVFIGPRWPAPGMAAGALSAHVPGPAILSLRSARLRLARRVAAVAADGCGTGTRHYRAGSRAAHGARSKAGHSAATACRWATPSAGFSGWALCGEWCSLTLLILALRAAHVFYFGAVALHGVRAAEVRRVLGRVLPDRGLLRGILHPRIHPVHFDRGGWLLAGGDLAVAGFRRAASGEPGRRAGWEFWRHADRLFLLPDSAAHRQPLVCDWLSCVVGLGRELSLFGPRQRWHGLPATCCILRCRARAG